MPCVEGSALYWGFTHKAIFYRILYCLTVSTNTWYVYSTPVKEQTTWITSKASLYFIYKKKNKNKNKHTWWYDCWFLRDFKILCLNFQEVFRKWNAM